MTETTEREARERFLSMLEMRLGAGAEEYGNASFAKPIPHTTDEILDEILDVAGWAYVLYVQASVRLGRLQIAMDKHVDTKEPRG